VSHYSLRLPAVILPLALLAACATGGPQGGTKARVAPAPRFDGTGIPDAEEAGQLSRLKGLTPVQLKTILGTPGFRRRDEPAEIWQYRGQGCILDVFLYDGATGKAVQFYSVRGQEPAAEKTCVDDLLRRVSSASGG
jgi:hypothetical protein